MKKLPSILCYLMLAMSVSGPAVAQSQNDRDEQMINASLRFIKEKATLNKKEYQKFAKIYSDYNEELALLNRELKPDNPEYMKRWNSINGDYTGKLEKELADTTRRKIGMAQWELSQKIFRQWSQQNRQEMDDQTRMWMISAQVNHPFMMMQPQVMDARRRQMENMEQFSEQQRQWMENFRRYWNLPDSVSNHDTLRSMMQNHMPVGPQGMIPSWQGGHGYVPRPFFGHGPAQNGSRAFNPMFHQSPVPGGHWPTVPQSLPSPSSPNHSQNNK